MFFNFRSVYISRHNENDEISLIIGIIKGSSQLIFVFKRKRYAVFTGYEECLLMLSKIFIQRVPHFGEAVHV